MPGGPVEAGATRHLEPDWFEPWIQGGYGHTRAHTHTHIDRGLEGTYNYATKGKAPRRPCSSAASRKRRATSLGSARGARLGSATQSDEGKANLVVQVGGNTETPKLFAATPPQAAAWRACRVMGPVRRMPPGVADWNDRVDHPSVPTAWPFDDIHARPPKHSRDSPSLNCAMDSDLGSLGTSSRPSHSTTTLNVMFLNLTFSSSLCVRVVACGLAALSGSSLAARVIQATRATEASHGQRRLPQLPRAAPTTWIGCLGLPPVSAQCGVLPAQFLYQDGCIPNTLGALHQNTAVGAPTLYHYKTSTVPVQYQYRSNTSTNPTYDV